MSGAPARESRVVRAAERLFSAFLRVLPPRLYAGFAAEMRADFSGLAREARASSGVLGVLFVFVRSLLDLLFRSATERWPGTDVRGTRLPLGERMQLLTQELRLAARTIRKRPGFTFVAVLTLALGIGANVAIFAVVNAVLIRPLPYPQSERLVRIQHHAPGLNLPDIENSAGTIELYKRFSHSFASQGTFGQRQRNLTGVGDPARVSVLQMSPSLFDVLRVAPMMGRRLVAADAKKGAPPVVVLTYGAWSTRFGADRHVLGRIIQLDGKSLEIVGVMPKKFAFPDNDTEVLVPMEVPLEEGFGAFGTTLLARLKPNVTLAMAQTEVTQLQPRIHELFPDVTLDFLKKAGWSATVLTLRDSLVGDAETGLWIVLGTVGFLLLVACASVANLFLVRAESRQREVAVRFALGGTRSHVAAVFLSESMLLGLAGGAWGLLLAYAGVRALVATGPDQLPRLQEVNLDLTVIGFALAISLLAGLIFGILPLPHQMRRPLHGIVRGGRGQTTGRERQRMRKTLIVTQIALALVLVTGSGLMLRSFQRLRAVNPGVNPNGVLTLGVSLGGNRDKNAAAVIYQRMLEEVAHVPGVTKVAATNALPLHPDGINGSSFRIESKPRAEGTLPPVSMYATVTGDYFAAIGTPIKQGRAITREDIDLKRPVAIVSEKFVKDFLGGKALGERIRFGDDSAWVDIVGIAADVHTFGLREKILPMAYLTINTPVHGTQFDLLNFIVRTTSDPMTIAPAVRAAIKRVEPNAPILTAKTMNELVADDLAETSFTTTILLIAALVALLLGAIGLYGVIGYVVSQRTQEIGVRIALGAVPAQVSAMVLRQGLVIAAIGVAAGLAGAIALTRLLGELLYEVDSRDPTTFVLVALIMLIVSGVAAYIPARRASSVSPLQALRMD